MTAARRAFLVSGIITGIYWIVLCVSTHLPPQSPPLRLVSGIWDKLLHFSAFGCLAVLIALTCALGRQKRRGETAADGTSEAKMPRESMSRFFQQGMPLINYVLIWTIVVAYGSLDEPTQTDFGRFCDVNDLLADTLGAMFGLICFAAVTRAGRWYCNREDPREMRVK